MPRETERPATIRIATDLFVAVTNEVIDIEILLGRIPDAMRDEHWQQAMAKTQRIRKPMAALLKTL